jgi:hypothetical protein
VSANYDDSLKVAVTTLSKKMFKFNQAKISA